MGYYNMIYQYSENKFLEKCKKSKVDGLIVVDLPYPENKNFALKCKKKGINFIQLVSPTTSQIRLKKIIKDSHDMIYYISMLSTTGGKLKVSPKKILEKYNKIKRAKLFLTYYFSFILYNIKLFIMVNTNKGINTANTIENFSTLPNTYEKLLR